MIRITNPKGEQKILSNEDFDKLLWKFIESETFKKMGNRKQSYRFLHALWKENAKQNCCENLSERKGL